MFYIGDRSYRIGLNCILIAQKSFDNEGFAWNGAGVVGPAPVGGPLAGALVVLVVLRGKD